MNFVLVDEARRLVMIVNLDGHIEKADNGERKKNKTLHDSDFA